MIVLKLIASVVLTVIAILLFRYGAKARERDEMPMLSFDSYGAGILVLIIAGFLFFSVID